MAVQGIMAPFPLPPGRNQAAIFQRFHMVRKRRLGNLHLFQQFTCTLFPISQKLNNPEPVGIGKCFTNQADLIQFVL